MKSHNSKPMIGLKFGKLTVLSEAERLRPKYPRYLCSCDCGMNTIVNGYHLRSGATKSCGCWNKDNPTTKTHGLTESDEYKVWCGMKRRCYNKNEPSYHRYGGNGITIAEEWLNSFEKFLEDMGNRPSKEYSIDRIDGTKGYYKDNCRWATKTTQSRNRKSAILVTFNNETYCITEWAERINIKEATLRARIKNGWDIARALTTQPKNTHAVPL